MANRSASVAKSASKSRAKVSARSPRGKLAPRAQKRGLSAEQIVLERDAPEVGALSEQVVASGGAVVGAYREPLSGRPVLLLYDAKAGHAGGQPFKKIVEDSTDELTFVASQLGVN